LEVTYDPSKITYKELLKIYWQSIDPTDYQGQFHDRGSQYQTAIFYFDSEQMHLAESSKVQVAKLLQTLVQNRDFACLHFLSRRRLPSGLPQNQLPPL
jgi:peptide methionine sulfoxide reductase MsrA